MKPKICYVITKSNFGGAQRYVYELATAFNYRYEVVVAFGGDGQLKDKLASVGIRTHTVESFQRDISILKEFRAVWELWKLYRSERPDIVHLNSSKAGGLGSLVARIAGVPHIVYTAHGWAFWSDRPWYWRAFAWLGSWVTVLLCHTVILVSEHEYAATRLPFTRHKWKVIHTAVPDINFLSRENARAELVRAELRQRHADDIWLVSIAELTANKNLLSAIDAVARYNARSAQKYFYTIIGGGEQRAELERAIRRVGAEEHILLLGYIDNARCFLKAFDAFMLPSQKEGMPYALIEAAAAGLPLIASKVGGVPEVVSAGSEGVLIDPRDSETMLHALAHVSDASVRARMGAAARAKSGQFSLSRMVEKTDRVYTSLLKS